VKNKNLNIEKNPLKNKKFIRPINRKIDIPQSSKNITAKFFFGNDL